MCGIFNFIRDIKDTNDDTEVLMTNVTDVLIHDNLITVFTESNTDIMEDGSDDDDVHSHITPS